MLTHANIVVSAQQRQHVRRLRPRRYAARLPADGLGRRPHLLLRPGLRRGHVRVLPGKPGNRGRGPARDRPDLFLRAAARVREPAHPDHGAHGGCRLRSRSACSTYFLGVARRCGEEILERQARSAPRTGCCIGSATSWCTRPLRNRMGFSRTRVAYTAGEAIGPELFRFYRSLGINLKQLYGQTEASVYITPAAGRRGLFRHRRQAGTRRRNQESPTTARCCFKSPGVFLKYYKNDEATRTDQDTRGLGAHGDAGFFDQRGHLKIIDRAKDVGRLNNGALFAPKYLENRLKFYPEVREAVAFGQGQRLRHDARQHRPHRRSATGPSATTSPMRSYSGAGRASPSLSRWSPSAVDEMNKALARRAADGGLADQALPRSCTRSSTPTTASSRAR